MTIRVLHVVTTMDIGGLETFIMNIYRKIDRDKVQFDFLKHRKEESFFDEEIRRMGGRIFDVSPINPLNHGKYLKELELFFYQHPEYDIIHSHINANSMYVLRAAKEAGINTRIAHSHNTFQNTFSLKSPLVSYAKTKIKKYTTHNFACGIEAGKWLYGEKAIKKSNFKVINNSISTEEFKFNDKIREMIRAKYGLKDNFVVGHIGSFSDQKNHDFIIDIFYEIQKIQGKSKLLLIGDGELMGKIRSKVKKLDLAEKVIFTGVQSNANELLQGMDVYLMPSKYEGLPVTMVEAQTSGIHSVISDTITKEVKITELVDYMPLTESPSVWAKTILQFDNNYKRRDTLEDVIKAGYDSEANAETLEKFYLERSTI